MSDISKSLAMFAQQAPSLDVPFDDGDSDTRELLHGIVEDIDTKERNRPKKKSKKDSYARLVEKSSSVLNELADESFIDDFDDYIDSYILDDEDADLHNSLVSQGRRYARDHRTSGESSELSKAFSSSEKMLDMMLDQVDHDKEDISKVINELRAARTRNFKALSELTGSKVQLHNVSLSIIKEKNSMIKTEADMKMKADKAKKEDDANDSTSSKAVQQLLGIGRGNLLEGIGGYSGVSGAIDEDDEDYDSSKSSDSDYDEAIERKYFSDTEETEGDLYLKYEGSGAHYILLVSEDDDYEIITEDKNGELIPDYPLPANVDKLEFSISETTGTATDNYNRTYEVRHV